MHFIQQLILENSYLEKDFISENLKFLVQFVILKHNRHHTLVTKCYECFHALILKFKCQRHKYCWKVPMYLFHKIF